MADRQRGSTAIALDDRAQIFCCGRAGATPSRAGNPTILAIHPNQKSKRRRRFGSIISTVNARVSRGSACTVPRAWKRGGDPSSFSHFSCSTRTWIQRKENDSEQCRTLRPLPAKGRTLKKADSGTHDMSPFPFFLPISVWSYQWFTETRWLTPIHQNSDWRAGHSFFFSSCVLPPVCRRSEGPRLLGVEGAGP